MDSKQYSAMCTLISHGACHSEELHIKGRGDEFVILFMQDKGDLESKILIIRTLLKLVY